MATHPRPDEALSDGPSAWPLPEMERLLETLKAIDLAVNARGPSRQGLCAPGPQDGGCRSDHACARIERGSRPEDGR